MKKYQSKYFGEINLTNGSDNYIDCELDFDNKIILIELELEEENIDQIKIQDIDHFLDKFRVNYEAIKSKLNSMLNQVGFVRDYISIIKDDFEDQIEELIDGIDSYQNIDEKLLSKLYICRLKFLTTDDRNRFAIIDFTIDEEITNDLLVIGIRKDSEIVYTFIES